MADNHGSGAWDAGARAEVPGANNALSDSDLADVSGGGSNSYDEITGKCPFCKREGTFTRVRGRGGVYKCDKPDCDREFSSRHFRLYN